MAEMQLQILSDLHLEAPVEYGVFTITPKAPFLALLGDIGNVKDAGFFEFLRQQLANFQVVFLVLGNHEPYHSSWAEAKVKLKRFGHDMRQLSSQTGKKQGEFVLLDQTRYDLSPTATILGCTLFSKFAPEHIETIRSSMNDFCEIKDWSLELYQEAYSADLYWLNAQVESISHHEPGRKIAILTHYSPCIHEQAVDPHHMGSPIFSAFRTDLSNEVCWTSGNVKVWGFGHTHFNCDFEDPKTGKRVVANQRGYDFDFSARFDAGKVVSI